MPGGETCVRQILYGKGYYRQKLGVDVTVGWLVDTFGHHAQMPQLLKLAGYKSFWFSRGVPRPDFPSEFIWEGIDGSRIPAFWLPFSYGIFYNSPRDLPNFRNFVKQRFDMLTPNSHGPDRVACEGADVTEPEDSLVPMVRQYNQQPDAPIALHIGVPTDFEAAVASRPDKLVFKGEMNPIFQGTYSSRIELKHWMRLMEQRLTLAEKLGCISGWLGNAGDDQTPWAAWEPVMFSETHDCASGVMTNHVYEDTLGSYAFSKRLSDEMVQNRWDHIASRIDTRGEGIPIIVFNSLGWQRDDVAEMTAGFTEAGVAGIHLTDNSGKEVPLQILEAARYPDGGLKQVSIAFIARDVPAIGYTTYRLMPQAAAGPAPSPSASDGMENDFYRATFDIHTGAMKSLVMKSDNWNVFKGDTNVVTRQDDHGDFWELYHGLNGGSSIDMATKEPVPQPGTAIFSSAFQGADPGAFTAGPVFSEFKVWHPFDNGTFSTRVRLYNGLRRIDIRTQLINNAKLVRYRALFPTTIKNGRSFHAIPFGAIERPEAIEFPAQNWVDYGDGQHGLAILNYGQPGNVVSDGTMMLSLLRSNTIGGYGFGGGYERGMASDSGLQLGKEITLEYSMLPHAGDWRDAGVFRAGMELNNPLVVQKVSVHAGTVPGRWGAVEISDPNVVVSTMMPGRDGATILRVFEATGRPASAVKIKLAAPMTSAAEVNLMEDPIRDLPVADNSVQFDLHGYEIKTFKLLVKALP
jgi:alpha-mannosidase